MRCLSFAIILTVLSVEPSQAAAEDWNRMLHRLTLDVAPLAAATTGETSTVGFSDASPTALRRHTGLSAIEAPVGIERLLQRMWELSPTFRRQVARLAESSTKVRISLDLPGNVSSRAAQTEVEVRGRVDALVHLRPADRDQIRHLAHEIEHVLEQLDGVDLRAAAAAGVRGVHLSQETAAFETDRAIVIGWRVAREVERGRK